MLFAHMPSASRAQERSGPESGASWETIFSSLEDGVVVIDPRGTITFFNQAAEVLAELPASQILGRDYSAVFAHTPWLIAMVQKSTPPEQTGSRGEGDLARQR